MYNITRQEAASILWISTRSVDRYVKAGKLRAKKDGKIIYIHEWDVQSIGWQSPSKQEVIMPTEKSAPQKSPSVVSTTKESGWTLEKIYADLRSEIQKKDTLIQNLSLQLWEAKEIARNSVSLVEFKKSQFLLEESKWYLNKEVSHIKEDNEELQQKLKYEKTTNYMLIGFVIVLFITLGLVWFIKI